MEASGQISLHAFAKDELVNYSLANKVAQLLTQ